MRAREASPSADPVEGRRHEWVTVQAMAVLTVVFTYFSIANLLIGPDVCFFVMPIGAVASIVGLVLSLRRVLRAR